MAYQIPPPPEGRFGKWAYQLWDYVRANRGGAATQLLGSSPVVVGTGTAGTFTVRHETSGVAAGSYGTSNVIPRFAVDSHGHVTSATNAGTVGTFAGFNSLIIAGDALGTTTTSTLTAALSTTGVAAGTFGAALVTNQLVVDAKGRVTSGTNAGTLGTFAGFNSFAAAGIVTGTTTTGTLTTAETKVVTGYVTGTTTTGTFTAGYAGTLVGAGDVLGTSLTSTFTGALSTTGVAAGTYGAAMVTSQLVVDAKGRVTSGTNIGTLGTFASFASLVAAGIVTGTTTTGTLTTARTLVGAGDVLGTSATNTFTGALSTTGVAAGTYGAATSVSQLVVDAKGRVTSGTSVPIAISGTTVTGTDMTVDYPISISPTPALEAPTFLLPLNDLGSGIVNIVPAVGTGPATFTRATTAWTKLSSGLWASVASGTARSCYIGATTAVGAYGGYFAEDAGTQLVTPTASIRDMTNAAWVKGATMTAAKTGTGIDGVTNSCSRLTGGAVSATNTAFQTLTAAASSRTYSLWIKRVTGTGIINITQDGGSTYTDVTALINHSTLTRVSLTASVLNAAFGVQVVTSGDVILVDFNQFEAGIVATSPLDATGVAVRAADVLSYPMTEIVSVGSFYGEMIIDGFPTGGSRAFELNDGTANERILFNVPSTGASQFVVSDGGVNQCVLSTGTVTAGTAFRFAAAIAVNDFASVISGGTLQTDTSGSLPTTTTLMIGQALSSAQVNGGIKNIHVWQSRIANATLQALISVGVGAVLKTVHIQHGPSGVTLGTYGAAKVIPRFVVDSFGHLQSAEQAGTLGTFAGFNSLVGAGVVTGTSTTGTLTTAQNFLMGSSTVRGNVPVGGTALTAPITYTDISGTGGTFTFMNWSVPANALAGSAQALRIIAWGTAETGISIIQLLFGGGTAFSSPTSTGASTWNLDADIVAMSSGTQRYRSRFDLYQGGTPVSSIQLGTLVIGVSTAVPLRIFGVQSGGINVIAKHGALVDVRN